MKQNKLSLSDRLRSFKYAFNGLRVLVKEEHNARIHIFAALCAVIAGFACQVSLPEWIAIVFAIGFVITTEIINTVIENLADFISPEKNDRIKIVKDLSAAAVFISALTALTVGLVIFAPKVPGLFRSLQNPF